MSDRLVAVAQELICRVRDDSPEANGRWLANTATADERWALLFVLAAAVPVDVSWGILTDWVGRSETANGRSRRLRPHGTTAAARRHQARREPLCELCRASERQRIAARRTSKAAA